MIRKSEIDCLICGFAPSEEDSNWILHEHHLIPRSCNGDNTKENKLRVCPTCHRIAHRLIDKGIIPLEMPYKVIRANTIKEVRNYYTNSIRVNKKHKQVMNIRIKMDASANL